MLGPMTGLHRQAEGSSRTVGSPTHMPTANFAGRALVLRTQAQPGREMLRGRESAHVHTDLAQDYQSRASSIPSNTVRSTPAIRYNVPLTYMRQHFFDQGVQPDTPGLASQLP
jgi:hypothetical protein